MFAQLGAYVLTQLTQSVFLARCEVLLGHANRAKWQRQQTVDESVGAERQLERPATDIHDDGATDAELEMRERAAEGETSFVVAVQNVDFESGFLANQLHELRAVRGFADGARGDDFGALDTELLGERRHSSQPNRPFPLRHPRTTSPGRAAPRRPAALFSSRRRRGPPRWGNRRRWSAEPSPSRCRLPTLGRPPRDAPPRRHR